MGKIAKIVREIIENTEKTSIRRVAKNIGVDHGSLYRTLKEEGNPETNTIEKILDYLGYDIKFIKRKEVKRVKPKQSKRKREVKKDGGLS